MLQGKKSRARPRVFSISLPKVLGLPQGVSIWLCGLLLTVLLTSEKRKVPFKERGDLA